MRWQGQTLTAEDPNALPGLQSMAGLVRSVQTPEFAGITFHEVRCRSALNHVPSASRVPFRWTVNPYRGCSHACVYCFARNTHTYLDLDPGADFDRQIVVKINIAEVLRRELARPRWTREHVAMGTNTDPYQRAEGRYRLMPQVISALAGSRTPFSILTKGTLLSRDLPLLSEAANRVKVGVSISLALLDEELHATLEPGTPTPRARLELVRRIRAAGLPCGVLVAPILPYLTDSDAHLEALVRPARGRRGHRHQRHRALPAAGDPRVVLRLAAADPPRAGRPLRAAVRPGRVRAQGVRRRPAAPSPRDPGRRPGDRRPHRPDLGLGTSANQARTSPTVLTVATSAGRGGRAMTTTGMRRSPAASSLAAVWVPPESLVSSTSMPASAIKRRSSA